MSDSEGAGGGNGPSPGRGTSGGGRSGPAPVLVLGCGNELAGADGFGPRAARRLQASLRRRERAWVEIREAGVRTDLLDLAPGRWAVLVLDAALAPGVPPGLVFDVDWRGSEARHLVHGGSLSSHGFGVAEQLALADKLGLLPARTRLLGVTVEPAAAGAPPPLGRQCTAVVRRAAEHIERWLAAWRTGEAGRA